LLHEEIDPTNLGWSLLGRPAEAVKAYTESVSFDWRLYNHDIAGSIAHAKGLAKVGLLTHAEVKKIEHGLRAIQHEIESGKFEWDRDCEMFT